MAGNPIIQLGLGIVVGFFASALVNYVLFKIRRHIHRRKLLKCIRRLHNEMEKNKSNLLFP